MSCGEPLQMSSFRGSTSDGRMENCFFPQTPNQSELTSIRRPRPWGKQEGQWFKGWSCFSPPFTSTARQGRVMMVIIIIINEHRCGRCGRCVPKCCLVSSSSLARASEAGIREVRATGRPVLQQVPLIVTVRCVQPRTVR